MSPPIHPPRWELPPGLIWRRPHAELVYDGIDFTFSLLTLPGLQTQKTKLRTAVRGHKLLKDKQDALTKLFLEKVHTVRELREHTESELKKAYSYFMIARGVMDTASANMVFDSSSAEILLKAKVINTLGVRSPEFEYEHKSVKTY